MRLASVLVVALVSCWFTASAKARAPDTFEEDFHPPILIESPQWFAIELKVGPYQPGEGDAFKNTFLNDRGWMLNVELDFTLWHIPYLGQLNAGVGWGWGKYDAKALTEGTDPTTGQPVLVPSDEDTDFVIYPMSALAVFRVDALARYTVVPLTFAGKLGYEWARWKATTGDKKDGDGVADGVRWGMQGALELDFLGRGDARQLDEDFGINHTFFLFEYYRSATGLTGDKTFSFGLGAQF